MNKILIFSILLICLLFSGCVDIDDKQISGVASDSLTDSKSVQTPDLIVKTSDFPTMTLEDCHFMAASNSESFNILRGQNYTRRSYTDVLPTDTRNVGESSTWSDKSGHKVMVDVYKSDLDSDFEEDWKEYKKHYSDMAAPIDQVKYDTLSIGTDCFYTTVASDTNSEITCLDFISPENILIHITVVGENDKTLDEAIRIAKIVEDRLD